MSNDLDASGFSDKLFLREGREARREARRVVQMNEPIPAYPKAEVVDAAPVYKEMGKDLTIRVSWDELTTAAFSLSLHHAVKLRNALDEKLGEHDEAALGRIEKHLDELQAMSDFGKPAEPAEAAR